MTQSIPILAQITARSFTPGMEADVLALLNTAFEGKWGDLRKWKWKHLQRPGFGRSDILVYSDAGKVVGCLHLALGELTLEPGLTVPYSFEGDLAVDPRYRRLGIMLRAHIDALHVVHAEGAILRVGFTSEELHSRVYRTSFGHTLVPTATNAYRKIIGVSFLRERLIALGARLNSTALIRRMTRKAPLELTLHVSGFPPCQLTLGLESVRCEERLAEPGDIVICLPYRALVACRNSRLAGVLVSVGAFLKGDLRIQGMGRVLLRLLRTLAG